MRVRVYKSWNLSAIHAASELGRVEPITKAALRDEFTWAYKTAIEYLEKGHPVVIWRDRYVFFLIVPHTFEIKVSHAPLVYEGDLRRALLEIKKRL